MMVEMTKILVCRKPRVSVCKKMDRIWCDLGTILSSHVAMFVIPVLREGLCEVREGRSPLCSMLPALTHQAEPVKVKSKVKIRDPCMAEIFFAP